MEDNIDDLIADFLSGDMDPATRDRFEQRLAAEPELAARVALERDIATALDASSPENKLRANLRQIADKYPSLESFAPYSGERRGIKARNLWIIAAGLLILGALAYWQFQPEEKPLSQPDRGLPAIPAEEEVQKTQEVEKPSPAKQQPIAAAYQPIPKLESYIGSQTRSGAFQILLDEPKSGASFLRSANRLTFRLSGKVEGSVPAGAGLNLLVFSNNQKDFEDLRAVESRVLEINPDGTFLVRQQWTLPPGLYYLVIEDQQSGEWLLVDKFLVKT